jgi:hypothetical protein
MHCALRIRNFDLEKFDHACVERQSFSSASELCVWRRSLWRSIINLRGRM